MITANPTSLIIIFSVIFLMITIFVVFTALKSTFADSKRLKERLSDNPESNTKNSIIPASKSLGQFADHLTMPDEDEVTRIRFDLSRAGYYAPNAVKYYYAIRVICLFLPLFIVLLFWNPLSKALGPNLFTLLACGLIVVGLVGPTMFVKKRQNKRGVEMKNGFPDFMDLLVASIEAGVGMDAALARVGNEIGERYPALKVNLDLLNLELRAGRERTLAMANFAKRLGLEEAKALSVMLKQSEEMGSSLGSALRTFSSDMRTKRMLKAEEKAMALSVKLTVPLIIFIFPAIMVMLLLPAGVRFATAFSAL